MKYMTLLLFSSLVFAQQGKTHVKIYNKELSTKPFEDKGHTVNRFGQQKSELPSVSQRDSAFKKSGVSKYLNKFDELDKDMLYVKTKKMAFEKVCEEYSNIPRYKLIKLKKIISGKR